MINAPALSVLMPVYNGEKYLKSAIESVLNQTYSNFEFIIVDDNSTDDTYNIAQCFAQNDSRIKLFKNLSGKGLVSALNFGIDKCSTNWIARFDADDICKPTRFEKQMAYLNDHSDVMVLGTAFTIFDDQGTTETIFHPQHPLDVAFKFTWNTRVGHPTVIFNKKLIESVGKYPQMSAEDFALFSRISFTHKIANLMEPLLLYRSHQTNKSKKEGAEIGQDLFKITQSNLNLLKLHNFNAKDYLYFHWGVRQPLSCSLKSYIISHFILFKILVKLNYIINPRAMLIVIPKLLIYLQIQMAQQLKKLIVDSNHWFKLTHLFGRHK